MGSGNLSTYCSAAECFSKSKIGDSIEEWVYGQPPGKVTFVKFDEGKVVNVEESYANVGGATAPPLPPVR